MKQTSAEIRSEFLKYFEKNGHVVVESSGLVPRNDPTLLFTNAGMVQFKDVFLGIETKPYKRATTSQKCVRAGGKHNDLENVGLTARHHTFFEMLGNFSFGDYFKKEAIHFSWEFITKNLGIKKDKLYVSVYQDDDEAAHLWEKQETVPKDRIYRFGEKDNFWAMGDTGPCGPCSEIFIDRGEKYGCKQSTCAPGCDCDRFMEVWNLVFMQYNRDSAGKLTPLPKPSIDTGMGLERLSSIIQGGGSNYDTDLFQDLIHFTGKLVHKKYGQDLKADIAFRVIADHARATNFLIADGVLPSNEGRGYVLRRIMRRAIRNGRNLGFKEPFFYKLTSPLIELMGSAYPELQDKQAYLESTIRLEEERFLLTLENGLKILEEEMLHTTNKTISGNIAFKLYDTFGFPLDLTQVIAKEREFLVDAPGFEQLMTTQRERSRESWKGSGQEVIKEIFQTLHQKGFKSVFKGYETHTCDGKVLALIEEGKLVDQTSTGSFQMVLDQTPFYAESGGQIGDQGEVKSANGFDAKVEDVKRPVGDVIVVFCDQARGQIKVGALVQQNTNQFLRALTAKNHTATHILHYALRKFLGPHVKQAGSLVTPELLRFDFTHPKPLTDEEIQRVEDFINESIARIDPVKAEEMDKEKALAKGAIAFFGDKYGAKVRVISVGDYSVELCGGTHVNNTADIQCFKIVNENGIAAGVRRIVAVTGPAVVQLLREKDALLRQLMESIKASSPQELFPKIKKMLSDQKELEKEVNSHRKKSATSEVDQWIANAVSITHKKEGISGKFIHGTLSFSSGENPAKVLRELSDLIRSKVKTAVIGLGAIDETKKQSFLLVAVTTDWQNQFPADVIIKKVAPLIEGSGGGRADLAQAGGKKTDFSKVFHAIENILRTI